MADDLEKRDGTIRAWKARNAIPEDEWPRVVAAAKARGIGLTLSHLRRLAAGEDHVVVRVRLRNGSSQKKSLGA